MRISVLSLGCAVALSAGSVAAADTQTVSYPSFKGGGDLRVRQEIYDDIPVRRDPPGVSRFGDNNYLRVRTRLWGEVGFSDSALVRGRLANEFRVYWNPDDDTAAKDGYINQWDALDELVVDNLYLDWKGLFGGALDARIGRQDMFYANGRILGDGTPKDGSRTFYFDAIKLTYKGFADNTIDFLAIYNQPENELVIDRQNRDLTGYTSSYNDMTESGGGLYWKNNASKTLPFEAYYLYKRESEWETARSTLQSPPFYPWLACDGLICESKALNLHTFGGRLMPKFGDTLDASIELAYQTGERGSQNVSGYMVDANAHWRPKVEGTSKPALGAGWYYLSGNDPSTSKDEGWNPLWARWPQYSELYTYAWDQDGAVRWSNLNMPYLDFEITPTPAYRAKVLLGYMMAPEEDGSGGGSNRGLLFTWWNYFTLGEKLLSSKDKLTGHLLLEYLNPGDYYSDGQNNSVFARWEFLYTF